MFEVHRLKAIAQLAFPTMVGMAAMNILTLTDTAMVGTLGDSAIAAVGQASFLNALSMGVFLGISSALQSIVSRRFGEKDDQGTWEALSGGLFLAAGLGAPIAFVLWFLCPALFRVMTHDPEVWAQGIPYFKVMSLCLPLQAMNFCFRGFFNGRQQPKVFMNTLFVMVFTNILFNYIFIFGNWGMPALGSLGAAIGTAASILLGNCRYALLVLKDTRKSGRKIYLPPQGLVRKLLRVGLPSSTRELSTMLCYTVFMALIARVGTQELAAGTVLLRLMTLAYLPAMGLGMAVAAMVGKALGQKDPEEAQRSGWEVTGVCVVGVSLVFVPIACYPDPLLRLFLRSPETLELARLSAQAIFFTSGSMGAASVLGLALTGSGYNKVPMIGTLIIQWLVFLPAVAWVIHLKAPYHWVWFAQIGGAALTLVLHAFLWQHGSWKKIKV